MPLDDAAAHKDVTLAPERAVRCARCGYGLTTERERIEVAGRHAHTFMNPSGVVFHIVCFRAVDGARTEGVPDVETSWFPGTAWIYAHCARCAGHVGWSYVHLAGGARFFALITDCITGS